MPIAWQIIVRCDDDRVLFPDIAERRRFSRVVGRVGAPFELLAFGAADTHGHLLCHGALSHARECARRLAISLSRDLLAGARLERPRLRPVRSQRHLANTFGYLHRQEQHHGVAADPLHEASSLPDLLGLRCCLPGLRARVRRLLPRVTDQALVEAFGVDPWTLARPSSLSLLADAAAASVGASELVGRSAPVRAARLAALALALAGEHPAGAAARALGISPRQARRLRSPPDPLLVRAVDGQWRLRASHFAAR